MLSISHVKLNMAEHVEQVLKRVQNILLEMVKQSWRAETRQMDFARPSTKSKRLTAVGEGKNKNEMKKRSVDEAQYDCSLID